jgi:hypothetical protein
VLLVRSGGRSKYLDLEMLRLRQDEPPPISLTHTHTMREERLHCCRGIMGGGGERRERLLQWIQTNFTNLLKEVCRVGWLQEVEVALGGKEMNREPLLGKFAVVSPAKE